MKLLQLNLKSKVVYNAINSIMLINLALAGVALLKDVFLAAYLGTSPQADAYWLAYFIPDMVGNLLGSSFSIACIPIFSRLLIAKENTKLKDTATLIMLFFGLVIVLLLIILLFARQQVIANLGPSLNQEVSALSLNLFKIMLPSIIAFPLLSIGTAMLQVHKKFTIPALAPMIFNLALLSGTLYGYCLSVPVQRGVYFLALSFLIGTFSMMGVVLFGMNKNQLTVFKLPSLPSWKRASGDLLAILKVLLPYLLILLSSQTVFAVERYLASHLEIGSIAGVNYAFRIAQFPLWVFAAAVSTVVFPSMAKALGLGEADKLKTILHNTIRQLLIILLPLMMFLYVLRTPIVAILLQRGLFNVTSVNITAGILAGYALSIVSQGLTIICLRAFLVLNRAWLALLPFVVTSCLNIGLDFILVNYLGSAGLGYATAFSALTNSVLLIYLLNRVLKLDIPGQLGSLTRIVAANLVLIPLSALFYRIWLLIGTNSGLGIKGSYVLGVILGGLIVYGYSLRLSKVNLNFANEHH